MRVKTTLNVGIFHVSILQQMRNTDNANETAEVFYTSMT
ncbi:hypothetical protein ALQ30_101990 [Pseudomonas syringae pv. persicae]|uniref:Uncharacterized protein n=1 Tax=Pseudomonas syringae pv. persicae TaxID=237306 RepID=A0A3M4A770_9PSED|nr:hypothetical protein ALQ30_101990 [Pseudomonas syringae pv. persicae]